MFTLPQTNKPSLIGVPSALVTLESAFARATASLYASDCLRAPPTTNRRNAPKAASSTKGVRQQPVGTNHFQFRLHQPGRAGGCGTGVNGGGGGGGGVDSIT